MSAPESDPREQSAPWNRPNAVLQDFTSWSQVELWTTDEAVALLLGRDPDFVKWQLVERYVGSSAFAANFRRLREQIYRTRQAGSLPSRSVPSGGVAPTPVAVFQPGELIAWASDRNILVPQKLRAALRKNGIPIAGLQQKVRSIESEMGNLQAERDALRKENAELRTQIDQLSSSETKRLDAQAASDGEFHGKVRGTINKMLYLLTLAKDGSRVTDRDITRLTGNIRSAADRVPMIIDKESVLDRLREAKEFVEEKVLWRSR